MQSLLSAAVERRTIVFDERRPLKTYFADHGPDGKTSSYWLRSGAARPGKAVAPNLPVMQSALQRVLDKKPGEAGGLG
jgi:hypothetical protein